MSAVVQDISDTFSNLVKDFNTTLGLVVGVAVFAFMLPILLQITGLIKSLTGK